MTRIPPTLQITLALVFLTCAILVTANLLFGVFPDPDAQTARMRKAFGESLAVQAAALLRTGDRKALELTLASIHEHEPGIRSLAVRRADRSLVVQSGDHQQAWMERDSASSTATHLEVPLLKGSERWGSFEMTYFQDERPVLQRVFNQPLWITLLFVAVAGMALYWVYMRRALVHLDPTAVIPERVRLAFDVMTEGVVVLDRRGRVLLANSAFRRLQPDASSDPVGKPLSGLRWLAASLPPDGARHPWSRAMLAATPLMSHPVEIADPATETKKLSVNCAPVLDGRGTVRGCLVTFDDLTALHLANERLFGTLAELRASRDEIQQKNTELEHLATHDTLTGCLTRRAFFERMTRAHDEAQRNGSALSCLILDVDRFKSVNDTFGHAMGDRVIQEVGGHLIASLRATDIIGRYGGDEFLVGMPGCDLGQAIAIAEKIGRRIETQCGAGISGPRVTVSIGVATFGGGSSDLASILQDADKALYYAKSRGRNQVAHVRDSAHARTNAQSITAVNQRFTTR
jgi:diguanylate cyclase (GGDEF)-like protein